MSVDKELPPVLNKDPALERMGGDIEIYHDVLAVFLKDAPLQLEKLSEALASGSREEVGRISHSLKSAAGTVGGEAMQASAARLELESASGGENDLQNLVRKLSSEFDRLRKELD